MRAGGPPIKVLFVSRSLAGGGAVRAATTLLRHLDRQRFRPELVVYTRSGAFVDAVPSDVPVHDLRHPGSALAPRGLVRLRRAIGQAAPDVVLTFHKFASLATLLVCRGAARRVRVVLSGQMDVTGSLAGARRARAKHLLHRWLYPRADGVIASSDGVREDLEHRIGISPSRIRVVHNAPDIAQVRRLAAEPPGVPMDPTLPTVLGVGRLMRQKGFPDLLEAFARVARTRRCRLVILGEGPDRAALEQQAVGLGIADRVLLPGFQRNPFAVMARSRVFVLSSRWEGFPYVLLEAMACGAAVVSTDCPSGPREVVTDGETGLLVPPGTVDALAIAIGRVLDDAALQARMVAAAARRVEAFTAERMTGGYEEALAAIVQGGSEGRPE